MKSIVVLLHEGGYQSGGYDECVGISDPIKTIAETMTPEVDALITGHTHQPYVCSIPDPAGNPRLVTSAASYGRVVTDTTLVINTRSGEVMRDRSAARNVLVDRTAYAKDPAQTAILDKWKSISDAKAAEIVGSHVEPILGDAGGNRAIETPMGDLVADAILWGTEGDKGGGADLVHEHRRRPRGPPDGAEVRRGQRRDHLRRGLRHRPVRQPARLDGPHRCTDQGDPRAAVPAGPGPWQQADARAGRLRGLHLRVGRHSAPGQPGRRGQHGPRRHAAGAWTRPTGSRR